METTILISIFFPMFIIMKERWKDLAIKTKMLYLSACIAFISGWVLTFWGFNMPPKGVIDNTVIVVLGQSMAYCGAAFGLKEYLDYQIKRIARKENKDTNEESGDE